MQVILEEIEKKEGWELDVAYHNIYIPSLPKRKEIIPHYHEYIEFLYGIEGTATVLVGNNVYKMEKDDLIMINAREPHTVYTENTYARYHVIKFLPKILYSHCQSIFGVRYLLPLWQKEISFLPVLRADESRGSDVGRLINEIMTEWNEKPFGYELVMKSNLMQVFVWLLRNRCPVSKIFDSSVSKNLEKILQRVLEEAEKHLADWTAEDAAKYANLSYSYFSRSFKQMFGISFSSYMESMRLREAERLLLTTDFEITEISYRIGFASTSHFIERFRKSFGYSPLKFRKQMRSSG